MRLGAIVAFARSRSAYYRDLYAGLAVGLARTPSPPPGVDNNALTAAQETTHDRQELPL